MMTLKQYNAWDGTYTMKQRAKAEKAQRKMLDTLTEEEMEQYFDLCTKHVYAYVDFGEEEEKRTAKELFDFCKSHGFAIEYAMMVY